MTPEEIQKIINKHTTTFPVPVVMIARELGIDLYETEDFDDSQSGSLAKEGDKFVIYVNARHAETRKRFSIAHELGHFIKHQDYFNNKRNEIIGEYKTYAELRRDANTTDMELRKMDVEANQVAADILMPEKEFKAFARLASSIEEIAERFNVSVSAASVRAEKLLGLVFA